MSVNKKISAVLLAAGYSNRMGLPKPLLLNRHGTTFLESSVNAFISFGCHKVVVVVNSEVFNLLMHKNLHILPSVSIILNDFPERGRFFSLQKGLESIEPAGYCFFHNADNPGISLDVLSTLASNCEKADIIRPVFKNNRGHPVLISQIIIKHIISEKKQQPHLREYLETFSTFDAEVLDPYIHLNINTPEDYESYMMG